MRRTTGSVAATGKLAHECTVRATVVPSTSTCNTARWSLSGVTITTESSGITGPWSTCCFKLTAFREDFHLLSAVPSLTGYFEPPDGFLLSNLSLSMNGLGRSGPCGGCASGDTVRADTITTTSDRLLVIDLLRNR